MKKISAKPGCFPVNKPWDFPVDFPFPPIIWPVEWWAKDPNTIGIGQIFDFCWVRHHEASLLVVKHCMFLGFVWWCTSQRSVLGQYFHIRGFPKMGYPGYPNSWMAYHGTSETNMDENWGTQISIYYSVPMCSPSLGAVVLNLLVLLEVIAIPQIPWWSCRFYSINGHRISYLFDNPICSMYGIFTYIWVIFRVNVGKYSIHGAYENIWTCLSDMICCTACIFQLQLS